MSKLKRWLFGPSLERVERLQHPRLGVLQFDDDVDAWRAVVESGGRRFGLLIGGEAHPHEALVAAAEAIVQSGQVFRSKIESFLEQTSRTIGPPLDKEIVELTIDDVMIAWPDRPNDAMIFFSNGHDYREWRCDYRDGVLSALTFDD